MPLAFALHFWHGCLLGFRTLLNASLQVIMMTGIFRTIVMAKQAKTLYITLRKLQRNAS